MIKQSILGKILNTTIFNLLFLQTLLFGNVIATVDKEIFYQGDEVTIELRANGQTVEFSDLKSIGGFKIEKSSKSEQLAVVDGKSQKNQVASYTFSPNISMEIPAILVKIDGKPYKTTPIKIQKSEVIVSKPNDDFVLLMETSKQKVLVGEAIVMAIVFKHKADLEVLDAKLTPFESDGFLVKPLPNSPKIEKNGYIFYQNNYIIFPQKSGLFTLQNQLINVATRERKTNFMLWKRIFSNIKKIEVLTLPNKINHHGDFTLKASVDKKKTSNQNPINLTIKIDGIGNINDIGEFPLNLPNVVMYSKKPQIKTSIKDGNFGGEFIQKISLISENDFTIPPFTFQYFDPKTNTIKKLSTEPIEIKVDGDSEAAINKIINSANIPKNEEFFKYLFALVGFIFGFFVAYVFIKKSKWKQSDTPLIKRIKIASNDKELYDILLPYANKSELKIFMKTLEGNIYGKQKIKIDKKAIIELFEDDVELR